MRNTLSILSAAVLAATFAVPAAAEIKIGVIDTATLLRGAPQIQDAEGKIKGEFQKREDDLKVEGKKLEDDIRKFQREADTMSPQQRTSAQNDLNTRKTNFDIKQRQLNEEFQTRNNELQRDVRVKLKRAIDEVAQEKSLDLIVQDPAYSSPAIDVTAAILEKLKAYGTAAEPKKAEKKKK